MWLPSFAKKSFSTRASSLGSAGGPIITFMARRGRTLNTSAVMSSSFESMHSTFPASTSLAARFWGDMSGVYQRSRNSITSSRFQPPGESLPMPALVMPSVISTSMSFSIRLMVLSHIFFSPMKCMPVS